MNRIILIGNGFDLAHNLKTSYKDFITDYWEGLIINLLLSDGRFSDDNIEIKISSFSLSSDIPNYTTIDYIIKNNPDIFNFNKLYKKFREKEYQTCNLYEINIGDNTNYYTTRFRIEEFIVKNSFLRELLDMVADKQWLDIETLYYRKLKAIVNNTTLSDDAIRIKAKKLNDDLAKIEKLLAEYLGRVTGTGTTTENSSIKNNVFSVFNFKVLSVSNQVQMIENLYQKLSELGLEEDIDEQTKEKKTAMAFRYTADALDKATSLYNTIKGMKSQGASMQNLINKCNNETHYIINQLMYPNEILILDFNYTATTSLYRDEFVEHYNPGRTGSRQPEIIHIHGQLNHPYNPIIFGYGDERGEDYQKLENLEENELLENIKSIKYLNTSNYDDLLSFIESDEYEVFVMGHSCGNSDRTLLSALFEHSNCLSIQPFYYEWIDSETKEQKDNYSDIVRNISRNFSDKTSMRSKVVNKEFCWQLTEPPIS